MLRGKGNLFKNLVHFIMENLSWDMEELVITIETGESPLVDVGHSPNGRRHVGGSDAKED